MQRIGSWMFLMVWWVGLCACAPTAPPTTAPAPVDPAAWLLVPNRGAGYVHFDMRREDVRHVLGVPERSGDMIDEYLSRGLAILYDEKQSRVAAIFYGDATSGFERPGEASEPAPYGYRTPEGIGMNATAGQIIAAYGNPSESTSTGDFLLLRYPRLNMDLTLRDGLLKHIALRRPPRDRGTSGESDGIDQ